MTIQYVLMKNYLTGNPNDYFAKVCPVGVLAREDIIDRMVLRGSTIGRADILGVLQLYDEEIEKALLEGWHVNTDLVNYGSRIKGMFKDFEDSFSSDRHSVLPRVYPGRKLRAAFRGHVSVSRQKRKEPLPLPLSLEDVASGTVNGVITAGGIAVLSGYRLKYSAENPEEGIFFLQEEGREGKEGAEVKVESVAVNTPKQLVFKIPDNFHEGEYRLEVRAVRPGGRRVRSGRLSEVLRSAG